MEQLPSDILRLVALNLPLSDILELCKTSKRFQQHICNHKPFWEALFLREVDEKIEIPSNAPIDWYKEKLKYWPETKNLIKMIKENRGIQRITYISHFNPKWNSFEILENIGSLHCHNSQLISLPPIPKLGILACGGNLLTSLLFYPNLRYLDCHNNQLTIILPYPNLTYLDCRNNKLTTLPHLPKLKSLRCKDNPLPFFTLEEWKNYWNK